MLIKKLLIIPLLLCPLFVNAQTDTFIPGSLFEPLCRISAIDSCGNVRQFPKEMQPHIQFYDFKNKKIKLNKFDRYRKKHGFDGMVKITSDTTNFRSRYWCRIKGYYKIEANGIRLDWDDNFKVEEHFDQINSDLSYWFLIVMNTYATIEFSERGFLIKGNKSIYNDSNVCISLVIKK